MYEIVTAGTSEVGTSIRRHYKPKFAVADVPLAAPGNGSNGNNTNVGTAALPNAQGE